jgi:hypothetical protein
LPPVWLAAVWIPVPGDQLTNYIHRRPCLGLNDWYLLPSETFCGYCCVLLYSVHTIHCTYNCIVGLQQECSVFQVKKRNSKQHTAQQKQIGPTLKYKFAKIIQIFKSISGCRQNDVDPIRIHNTWTGSERLGCLSTKARRGSNGQC